MPETKPAPAPAPPTGLNKPMTRRGCVLGLLAWAVLMSLPICVLIVAVRGEVAWERGPFVEDRVWLVRVDEGSRGARPGGVAYGTMRITSGRPNTDGPVCVTTNIRFWMWRGESETVRYCECYQPVGGGEYEAAGECE